MLSTKSRREDEVMDEWGRRFFAAMDEYKSVRQEIRADLAEAVAGGDAARADRLRRALGFLTVETRKRGNKP